MPNLHTYALLAAAIIPPICAQNSRNWPGWDGIQTIFSFGDSYTDTGFEINGTQPNPSNPFGNPDFPGKTFSNGRNWIDFLAYSYNDSYVSVYNLAKGGASVDSFGGPNPFRPFDQQVEDFFLPNYSQNDTSNATWSSNDTLFTAFFGINDVNASYKLGKSNMTALHQTIFATYTRLVEALYQAGAKNFVFMNVPAINRSPAIVVQAGDAEALAEANRVAVEDFNTRLSDMVQSFVEKHEDVAVFTLDNNKLYNQVLDDPASRPETEVYTNTTGVCYAYAYGSRDFNEDNFNKTCGAPQKAYFWLDSLHPTPPIHDAMAADVAAMLRDNRFVSVASSNSTDSTLQPNSTTPAGPSSSSDTSDASSSFMSTTNPLWNIVCLGAFLLAFDLL